MRIVKVNNVFRSGLKYLAPVLASGLIAMGSAGTAYGHEVHGYQDSQGYYRGNDDGHGWNHGRAYGHYKHHKPVKVYHHYHGRPVKKVKVIHHHYYEPEPVYIERRRVVRHYYAEPAPVYRHGGHYGPSGSSLIGAAIGGLVGSQFGKGDGKLATTAAGAVTGYWIGAQH